MKLFRSAAGERERESHRLYTFVVDFLFSVAWPAAWNRSVGHPRNDRKQSASTCVSRTASDYFVRAIEEFMSGCGCDRRHSGE